MKSSLLGTGNAVKSNILVLLIIARSFAVPQRLAHSQGIGTMKAYNQGNLSAGKLILHPIADDFAAGKAGRILISKKRSGDAYHTAVPTTLANTVAQTQDGKVKITAHIMPASGSVGQTVYFRLVSPDPDDQSSYEADGNGGDNKGSSGSLSASSAVAVAATINGSLVAAAEVELTITNQYAGDNYRVEASFDPNFASGVSQTCILVAWKRVYLEYDQMYKKGATIVAGHNPDMDSTPDVLSVDDVSDFDVTGGDSIIVFTRNGTEVPTTVQSVDANANTLTVPDLNNALPQYSGVRLADNAEAYSVDFSLLESAFGGDTNGTDGGAFVEFKHPIAGSGYVPHYTRFDDFAIVSAFHLHWFANSVANAGNQENVFLVAASQEYSTSAHVGVLGVSDPGVEEPQTQHITVIFVQKHTRYWLNDNDLGNNTDPDPHTSETVVHELGHQFKLHDGDYDHVDLNVGGYSSHDNSDKCIMSYFPLGNNPTNDVTEFDTTCINHIRELVDPIQ